MSVSSTNKTASPRMAFYYVYDLRQYYYVLQPQGLCRVSYQQSMAFQDIWHTHVGLSQSIRHRLQVHATSTCSLLVISTQEFEPVRHSTNSIPASKELSYNIFCHKELIVTQKLCRSVSQRLHKTTTRQCSRALACLHLSLWEA